MALAQIVMGCTGVATKPLPFPAHLEKEAIPVAEWRTGPRGTFFRERMEFERYRAHDIVRMANRSEQTLEFQVSVRGGQPWLGRCTLRPRERVFMTSQTEHATVLESEVTVWFECELLQANLTRAKLAVSLSKSAVSGRIGQLEAANLTTDVKLASAAFQDNKVLGYLLQRGKQVIAAIDLHGKGRVAISAGMSRAQRDLTAVACISLLLASE